MIDYINLSARCARGTETLEQADDLLREAANLIRFQGDSLAALRDRLADADKRIDEVRKIAEEHIRQ